MNYSVKIYQFDFSTQLTTLFYSQDIYDFSYFTEINKPGGAKFTINVRNAKATTTNLKMFNKVVIERNGVGVFIGYIENIRATVNTVDVVCVGMLGFFRRRLFSKTFTSGGGDTAQDAFFEILDDTNTANDTGITQGLSTVFYNLEDIQFVRSKIYDAWSKLASLSNGEFAINTDRTLDFLERLGEDKSDSIILQYNVNQINSANLREFDVEVQGRDTTNKVIGVRKGGIAGTESDTASILEFGLLEDTINLSYIDASADLTAEMENFIERHKIEFYSPKVTIDEEKIDVDTLNLGDTVRVSLNNGFMSLALNERIVKKEIDVSDNATEIVKLSLIVETGNLLPSSFIEDIIGLSDRVALLESEL